MIRGKTCDTSVMHDLGVSLRHEKDAVQKSRSQPRWVAWQSLKYISGEAHELDRTTAPAGNDPGVLDEEAVADAEWQEQHDRECAMETSPNRARIPWVTRNAPSGWNTTSTTREEIPETKLLEFQENSAQAAIEVQLERWPFP